MGAPWWTRPGLEARDGRLLVAGRDAEEIAREHGTPVFAYDLPRIEEQARGLIEAFERAGIPLRLRLALKAQRDPEVLAFVRGLGTIGIDACSPGEVHHALEHGWSVAEISFTGTNLSGADVDALLDAGVHVNLDLLSQLDRWGRRAPGTTVGIRINPRVGASSNPELATCTREAIGRPSSGSWSNSSTTPSRSLATTTSRSTRSICTSVGGYSRTRFPRSSSRSNAPRR
jgi:diaminopimelate decarboxylase